MFNEYAAREIDGRMCIWLQDFGYHAAKPLGQVVVGDVMVYNFGGTAEVVGVEPSKTGATIALTVLGKTGQEYKGKPRRATTLVAVRDANYR